MVAFASADVPKAQFHISLKRPEPGVVPPESIVRFEKLLASVSENCWEDEVNECSAWIQEHVAHSQTRMTACIKYFAARVEETRFPNTSQNFTSSPDKPTDRCTALIYIMNDLLHRIKFHGKDQQRNVLLSVKPSIQTLINNITKKLDQKSALGHYVQIVEVVKLWECMRYFDIDFAEGMRQNVEDNMNTTRADWYLPERNGNPSKPWFEQTTGSWSRGITRVHTEEDPQLNPSRLAPVLVRGNATLASNSTRKDTEELGGDPLGWENLRTLKKFDSRYRRVARDEVDEIGIRDEESGGLVETQDYYGFDNTFKKMQVDIFRALNDIDLEANGESRRPAMRGGSCADCN